MQILAITEQIPSRFSGGTARQFNLIRELSRWHEISLVSYSYPVHLRELDAVKEYVRRVEVVRLPEPVMKKRSRLYWQLNGWRHALLDPFPLRGRYPRASEMRSRIGTLVREQRFDLVQVQQAYLAKLLPEIETTAVLDMADILSEHERRLMLAKTKATHRFAAWLEWKKMEALERRAVRRFDVCVTASEDDRERFVDLFPSARVEMIANGVDVEYFQPRPAPADGANLVFVGSMQYEPNRDGVLYFYRKVLPLIREQRPDIQFYVVGWGPPPDILALDDDPNVTVTGFVEDVRPYLADGTVVVVPLRFGSGTRLKILDAWSMAKPVISTSIGAEGLAVRDGENIMLADSPELFARSVLDLLGDREARASLGRSGRQLVKETYAWSVIGRQMNEIYNSVRSGRRLAG